MFLGIEIGGTKLQLGVGRGDGTPLVALERLDVRPENGPAGIRRQIEQAAAGLIARHGIRAVGIGFGGPVDSAAGRTVKSHQIDGWEDYSLCDWCRQTLGLPAAIYNDSDAAGLAEARFGGGRGESIVFYNNVGSGIGGALVIDGQVYRGGAGIASEIGQLRPGLQSDRPEMTVESVASGWGIAAAAQAWLADPGSHTVRPAWFGSRLRRPESVRQQLIDREEAEGEFAAELLARCDGQIERLTCKMVLQAAGEGNVLAQDIFHHAVQTLGWALGQVITLLSPKVIVMGGGVPLAGEVLFFAPLREEIDRYVIPPLLNTFRIVPAELGEEVVVHGALAVAAGEGLGI